jgi:hypothetical protein
MKTYGDVGASRRSLRSAPLSRADIGCTLASPLLALRTCTGGKVDVVPTQSTRNTTLQHITELPQTVEFAVPRVTAFT